MPPVGCPNIETVERLILGTLEEAEEQRVADHLAGCPHCATTVETLKLDDTLIDALRSAPTPTSEPDETFVATLINHLERLAPQNTAAAATQETAGILAPPQQPGELGRMGPYRVSRLLGVGGMGAVFEAEDTQLQRRIALKAMKPLLAASDLARQRFLREARATAALRHDHIVTIYQVSEDRGVPFLAMELLHGEPLESRLRRAEDDNASLTISEVVQIGRDVADALAFAHGNGLIHRDITPGNIWLEATDRPPATDESRFRHAKLLDFGLVRAVEGESELTQLGALAGTPPYMSPEQARGEPLDERSDLFSLGAVLYRCLTGEAAF